MAVSFAGRPRLASSNAIKVVPELLESSRRVPVLWSPVFGGSLVLAPPPAILHQLQPLEVCFEGEAESGRRMIAKVGLPEVVAAGQVPASPVDIAGQVIKLGGQLVDRRRMALFLHCSSFPAGAACLARTTIVS